MQRVFEALSSAVRRDILVHLAATELSAGDIAARFTMSKPSISQHLTILAAAGLVVSEKRGQHVFYSLVAEEIAAAFNGFGEKLGVKPGNRPAGRSAETKADAEQGCTVRRHLVVNAEAQSLFFRGWFVAEARRRSLDGRVRNRRDGSVEAVVQGPSDMVEALVGSVREGSSDSRTAEVTVSDETTV